MSDEIPSTPTPTVPVPTHNPKFRLLCTGLTIGFWYLISNCIILTTKWLFKSHFEFPLIVTTFSNGLAFLWALLVSSTCVEREPLTSELLWQYVLPIGLTTALEIGSSNVALNILTVSFGTILKGGGPIFTFLWGLAFGLEQFSFGVGTSLLLIAVGIALASFGEGQEFELLGFCLQLFASALGGLRWAMTHKLLKQGTESGDGHHPMSPLTATLYTSPMTSLCVLPFALILEGKKLVNGEWVPVVDGWTNSTLDDETWTNSTLEGDTTATTRMTADIADLPIILSAMTFIGTLVFILLMSEYWLVKATSSLALSVAGIFKELITIGGGMLFFDDHIDSLNVVGFFICQSGILIYIGYRTQECDADEYAPITVEEAHREALESRQEMLAEFGSERYLDNDIEGEGPPAAAQSNFSIDDDDEML